MPTSVRFAINIDSDDEDANVFPLIRGTVFEGRKKAGSIDARLVQVDRAMEEGVSLYDAMDSIDADCEECYWALFDKTQEWNSAIEKLYGEEPMHGDVLFTQRLKLDAAFRGKGIGARVVRATISTFGSGCGLVICRPLPLQYCGQEETEESATQRAADLNKVRKFWRSCGFRQLPKSDYFTHAPWLMNQPDAV
jgi:GNAT superfamily N-acetyltransferase